MSSLFREPGLILSSVAHVALLSAGLVVFTTVTPFPDADEGIPVEFITDNMFSQITRGETDATEVVETPQPRAERQAEIRESRPPGEARVDAPSPPTRTQDIPVADEPVATAEAPPPPPPPPPPAPEPAPTPVAAEPPPPQPAPPDPAPEIAEAEPVETPSVAESAPLPPARSERVQAQRAAAARLEQERVEQARAAEARRVAEARAAEQRAREQQQAQETRAREQREQAARQERSRREAEAQRAAQARAREEEQARARREAETAQRFNPGDIAALLRSTDEARSQGAAAPEPNRTASLGTATGNAARLNPSQRDALIGLIQGQLRRCWSPPPAAQTASNAPTASIRIALNSDGSLTGLPQVVNNSSDPLFRAVADSATRATQRCAPLQIPAQFAPYYEDWKVMTVNFNPLDA